MTFALVTGGNKGIGRAIAAELARRQVNLLLVARSEDSLRDTSAELEKAYGIQVHWLALDLSESGAPDQLLSWCQQNGFAVNILVNNAGYGLSGPFERFPPDSYQNMMQVNTMVPVLLSRLFLPVLHREPKAYILNVSSSAAYQAVPLLTTYAATKAFLLSFSRGLHQELRKTNVSVTCVCPGSTDTGFADRAMLGPKGRKAAQRLNMTPEAVARIAVKSMFARKTEIITGFINQLGAGLAWLLPKALVERTAATMYE